MRALPLLLLACHHRPPRSPPPPPAELEVREGPVRILGVLRGAARDALVLASGETVALGTLEGGTWTVRETAAKVWLSVQTIDVEGDGVDELLVPNGRSVELWRQGRGGLVRAGEHVPSPTLALDITGDGRADEVDAGPHPWVEVRPADGGAPVRTALPTAFGAHQGSQQAGDVDGDGRVDLIADPSAFGVLLLYGRADGGFDRSWLPADRLGWRTHAGDLDGDGRADLLVELESGYAIYRQVAPRVWSTAVLRGTCAYSHGPFTRDELAVGDLDGDGVSEVAVTRAPHEDLETGAQAWAQPAAMGQYFPDQIDARPPTTLLVRRGLAEGVCPAPEGPAPDPRTARRGGVCVAQDPIGTTLRWSDGARAVALNAEDDQPFAQLVGLGDWALSPDGRAVAYLRRRESEAGTYELAVWRDGAPLWVSGPSAAEPERAAASGRVFFLDGQRVLYGTRRLAAGGTWIDGLVVEEIGADRRRLVGEGMLLMDLSPDGRAALVLLPGVPTGVATVDLETGMVRALGSGAASAAFLGDDVLTLGGDGTLRLLGTGATIPPVYRGRMQWRLGLRPGGEVWLDGARYGVEDGRLVPWEPTACAVQRPWTEAEIRR